VMHGFAGKPLVANDAIVEQRHDAEIARRKTLQEQLTLVLKQDEAIDVVDGRRPHNATAPHELLWHLWNPVEAQEAQRADVGRLARQPPDDLLEQEKARGVAEDVDDIAPAGLHQTTVSPTSIITAGICR